MSRYCDNEMILTMFKQKADKKIEKTILGEVHKVSYQLGIYVDKDKLKNWLKMCLELEKIDESERIGGAIRDKFVEKDKEIEQLTENQNQKAIECLKELKEKIFEIFEKTEFNPNKCGEYYGNYETTRFVGDIIDNKIKELEE